MRGWAGYETCLALTRTHDIRMRTSDQWIRIHLRIRLLSSVTLGLQKNLYFRIFSYYQPAGTLSSVLKFNFLLKFCVKILFSKHCFSPLNTFIRKGKGSGAWSIPLINGSGSGRPKNMRSCGSLTLLPSHQLTVDRRKLWFNLGDFSPTAQSITSNKN